MSVLIEGMEMPKSCDSCRIMVFEDTNCVDELYCGCPIVFEAHPQGVGRRPDYCPLIEVPEPHGDLIDMNAKIDVYDRYDDDIIRQTTVRGLINEYISGGYPSTVIPASEGG